ncbi:MAG TPA: hypothetical protein VND45_13825 [Thermoanaerobaculia bacterium]|jgi:hypothetical protein|nr:hypothetical protein [Thermoanaerobaculia bacterium]
MNATTIEPLLRNATIKAIDGVAKKLASAESEAETKIARLLNHWNELDSDQKEQAVGIAIATITTAVTAIVAMRRAAKSPVKAAAKSVAKRVVKRAAR